MATDSNYNVKKRRRREQSTDYSRRLGLLKSGKPRAVVRLSNTHTRIQIENFDRDGDVTNCQVFSGELEEYGWNHSTSNLPAAYLTGYLAGLETDENEAVLDTGLKTVKKGGRLFAAVKGLKDAGVEVPAGDEAFPEESRIKGEHIEDMTGKNVPEKFEDVKEEIEDDKQ